MRLLDDPERAAMVQHLGVRGYMSVIDDEDEDGDTRWQDIPAVFEDAIKAWSESADEMVEWRRNVRLNHESAFLA